VLSSDDPYQFLKFEPHFHLFFAAPRRSFDYLTAEAVEDSSGWLFHRITKSKDDNISISDLDDLVHQLTYCLSHAGVNEWNADRAELTTTMKGELHQCYIPAGVEDEVLASFCEAAPRLLGVQFSNLSNSTCSADLSVADEDAGDPPVTAVWEPEPGIGVSRSSSSRSATITGGGDSSGGTASTDASTVVGSADGANPSHIDLDSVEDVCGGELTPMHEAKELLDDPDWRDGAEHADALDHAVEEWEGLDDDHADEDVVPAG